jgi:replicative superfamily II helicase
LTTEERDLVATAYDQGVIKVMVATCSLAVGINLPARRVILHGAKMGAELVGPSMLLVYQCQKVEAAEDILTALVVK